MWNAVGVLQHLKTLQLELTEIAGQNERHTYLVGVNTADFLFRLQADDRGNIFAKQLELTTLVLVVRAYDIFLKSPK